MAATVEPGLHEVNDGVFVRIGSGGASNAGFVIGGEAVAVIDSLVTPAMARAFMAEIRRVTDKPVRYVINTHHHGDHTFGNQAFEAATIIAHRQCRSDLAATAADMKARFAEAAPQLAADLADVEPRLPEITFNQHLHVYLGDRVLQVTHHGPAHSKGDVVVTVPDAGTVFTGDLLTPEIIPGMLDADFPGWVHALDELRGVGAKTLIPGHGRPGTKDDLDAMSGYLRDLWGQVAEAYARGLGEEETLRAVNLQRYAGWMRQSLQPTGIRRAYFQLQERHRHRL